MRQITVLTVMIAMAAILLAGCQESESNMIRKARLVGSENIQLKKQLAEKDKEIQGLKDEIARLEKEKAREHEEFGNTTIKTLQIMAETQAQYDILAAENKKLKEELEKLKNE